jgi:hypothetical protein
MATNGGSPADGAPRKKIVCLVLPITILPAAVHNLREFAPIKEHQGLLELRHAYAALSVQSATKAKQGIHHANARDFNPDVSCTRYRGNRGGLGPERLPASP